MSMQSCGSQWIVPPSLHTPGLTWRAGSLAGCSHSAALLPAARHWSPRVTGRREKDS